MYILVIGDQFGFISTILFYFLTWPAFSGSFLPLFPCLVLMCVLILFWYDCHNIATDNLKLWVAHNYAKVFLTLSLRLGTALPARPFILYCGSTPRRLAETGLKDYRLSRAGGSGRNAGDKAKLCKDTEASVGATSAHIPLAESSHVVKLKLGDVEYLFFPWNEA